MKTRHGGVGPSPLFIQPWPARRALSYDSCLYHVIESGRWLGRCSKLRELKSSLLATAGGKGAEICPKTTLAGPLQSGVDPRRFKKSARCTDQGAVFSGDAWTGLVRHVAGGAVRALEAVERHEARGAARAEHLRA